MKTHFSQISTSFFIVFIASIFINPGFDISIYIWSFFSLAFVISVFFRILILKQREDLLFFTIILLTWLNFSQPYLRTVFVPYGFRVVPPNYLFSMSFFSSIGIVALYIGYYVSFNKKIINPFFSLNVNFNAKQIGHVLLGLMVLYFLFVLLNESNSSFIKSIIGIISILRYIPSIISAGVTLMFLRKNFNLITIIILLVFLMLFFIVAVAQTLFISIILIVAPPFMIYFFERKKIPAISIILAIIMLSPIFLLRHYYRQEAAEWWYKGKDVNTEFLIDQGLKILNETYGKDNIFDTSGKIENSEEATASRFEQVSYLGQCVYYHEIKKNPYLYGKTFWWLPIAPIPRVILPFKPENILATTLATEYGLRGKGSKAAMNWPMLVEYYVNFGFGGIIFFSFFQGLAYKYTYKLLAYGHGDLNLIILFSLILPIIKIESNVTLVFGQVLQFLFLWYILSRTVLKKYKYIKS